MAYRITESCTGCGACARLCPVFAISGERGAAHTINAVRCTNCSVCARVCPKGSICDETDAVPPRLPRREWPKPVIDQAACTACRQCIEACTPEALAVTLPQYRGDIRVFAECAAPEKCVGCGLCVRACPLRLITMQAPGGAA